MIFNFSFAIRQVHGPDLSTQLDTNINGLTYVSASTDKEVETLLTREFHADPNLHKNANVQLVGDFSTGGNQSVSFDWAWKWRPPKAMEDRGGGWRNTCCVCSPDFFLNIGDFDLIRDSLLNTINELID